MARDTTARSLHDLGAAALFGGAVSDALTGARPPVLRDVPALAAHVVGGVLLTGANAHRLAGQRGVARTSAIKTGVTAAVAALVVTEHLLARRSGGGADATGASPEHAGHAGHAAHGGHAGHAEVSPAPRALTVLRVAACGTLVVLGAMMGEQQRPGEVALGTLRRLLPDAISDSILPAA